MVKPVDKEELILKTAMDVFVEKGWHGTKMQEIADRAGINKALLHYYFRSKEKLYRKIFEYLIWNNIGETIKIFRERTDLPFEGYVKTFISQYISLLNKHPKIPLFLLRELSDGAIRVGSILTELINTGKFDLSPVFTRIAQAVDSGEIIEIDPRQLMTTIIGACLFFFIAEPLVLTLMGGEDFDRSKFIEERKQAVFKIVMYGVIPRGEK